MIKRNKQNSSVLGKLVEHTNKKGYSDKLIEINLVSVSGYSIPLKIPGVTLEKITITDIEEKSLKMLEYAIKKELNLDELPLSLQFVIPELPDKKFEDIVVGEISKLISTLYPNTNYNSFDIYRLLIDELNRKGAVTYDFANWTELLEKKALTSTTVTKIINQFTNYKNEALIESNFVDITKELGLNSITGKTLKRAFERYRKEKIGNKSTMQLNTTRELKNLINSSISNCQGNMATLIQLVIQGLPQKIKDSFTDEEALKAAIICEHIYDNYE